MQDQAAGLAGSPSQRDTLAAPDFSWDVFGGGLTAGSGDEFLRWLVHYLGGSLGVAYIFVGEVRGEDEDHVRTLALRTVDGLQENFDYDLLGTPCARVVRQDVCTFLTEVAPSFPDDLLLAKMGVDAYVGISLVDDQARPLGLIVALHTEAIDSERAVAIREAFTLWRPRVQAELERRRALRDLRLVLEGTRASGEEALRELTASLAHAMRVRLGFVTEVLDGGMLKLEALVLDGEGLPPCQIPLAGSLLEPVTRDCAAYISCGASERGPGDPLLAFLDGAESFVAVALTDAAGKLIGHVGLAHDRELGAKLHSAALFQAFASRIGAELERARADVGRRAAERQLLDAQRRESLGVLAGGIAHDFNNLLVAILGNADLAAAELPAGHPAAELIHEIEVASRRAAGLCSQMLAYAGRASYETENIDLGLLVREVSSLVQVSMSKAVAVRVQTPTAPIWVLADGVQLQQVVMNMLTNAGQAVDGSGQVSVTVGQRELNAQALAGSSVGAPPPGLYAFVEVVDDGVGMDEDTLARIFDPFFSTKATGHGLGLAAVLGIVEAHEGAVLLESVPGQGTTFTVALPASTGAPGDDALRTTAPDGEGLLALVVDDDASVRKVACAMLRRLGYDTVDVASGEEALGVAEGLGSRLAFVLVDYSMVGLSGAETARALRQRLPELPVILSSGYLEREVRAEFETEDVCAFLRKPYTRADLVEGLLHLDD